MDAPGLLPRLSRDPGPLQCRAGGNNALEEDARVLEKTGARNQPVILVTRGWEPPTGELSDFIVDARDHWPAGTLLALVPLADEQGTALTDAGLLAQWQRFVDRQGDSHLLLCAPREQDQP